MVNWGRMTSTPAKEIHHVKTTAAATTKTTTWVHPSPLDASHVFVHFLDSNVPQFPYSLQGWGWNYGRSPAV